MRFRSNMSLWKSPDGTNTGAYEGGIMAVFFKWHWHRKTVQSSGRAGLPSVAGYVINQEQHPSS